MLDEELESTASGQARPLVSRVIPRARFVQGLGEEIHRAARQRMGYQAGASIEEVVIELRKLVRLLRRTLVPVQARSGFARTLGSQLQARATELTMTRQRRWRLLMVGGVVGSALSLVGLVTALLLRRRNGRLQPNKPMGVV